MQREQVAAFVESDEGKAFLQERDYHWNTVMRKARECGFIIQAYGGTATLCTYEAMLDEVGTDGAVRMLQMSGVDLPIGGEG